MIEIADALTENHAARDQIEYRVGSTENIPVVEHSADYVFAFDSIDHWSDIDRGLSEIQKILQPDGMANIR